MMKCYAVYEWVAPIVDELPDPDNASLEFLGNYFAANKEEVKSALHWLDIHDYDIEEDEDNREFADELTVLSRNVETAREEREREYNKEQAELIKAARIKYFAKHVNLSVAAGFETENQRDRYLWISKCNNHPWIVCTYVEARQCECYTNHYIN